MPSVVVISVSFNTKRLTALLLWSLHRVLDPTDLSIVMVDNGSSDGTAEMLRSAERAGLCNVLLSPTNLGHGPALNLALEQATPPRSERVWILDSDCVIVRPDALTAPLTRHPDATIVGEQHWDPWHARSRLELYSLLATTDALRHEAVAPFSGDGDPAWDLLTSAEQAGLRIESFPFTQDGYLIHLGRASLAALIDLDDRTNPLFEWAIDHHDPHFGAVAAAPAQYAAVLQQFEREVGTELDLATALRT